MARAKLKCSRPDIGFPRLICGHPLPCPCHTPILDVSKPRRILLVGDEIDIKAAKRLITIGRAIQGFGG